MQARLKKMGWRTQAKHKYMHADDNATGPGSKTSPVEEVCRSKFVIRAIENLLWSAASFASKASKQQMDHA
jgi:hypothetical protein